jgi:hypothetical protein
MGWRPLPPSNREKSHVEGGAVYVESGMRRPTCGDRPFQHGMIILTMSALWPTIGENL